MILRYTDFNNANNILANQYAVEWKELEHVLSNMHLHLKPSDQRGKKGQPIFDPVGTNGHIKEELRKLGWQANIPIPATFNMWGTDVDYAKRGLIGEAQFSNYPFLLNNLIRSELFYQAKVQFTTQAPAVTVVVMKAYMLPASNSTLYYEQAANQISSIAPYNVFDVPLRLVGLFEGKNVVTDVIWTHYAASRYSRTVASRVTRRCRVTAGRARCTITLL